MKKNNFKIWLLNFDIDLDSMTENQIADIITILINNKKCKKYIKIKKVGD